MGGTGQTAMELRGVDGGDWSNCQAMQGLGPTEGCTWRRVLAIDPT